MNATCDNDNDNFIDFIIFKATGALKNHPNIIQQIPKLK